MEARRNTENTQQQPAEPVYLENTLLRVFGVLFCHDPKRARSRTGKIEINRGVDEKKHHRAAGSGVRPAGTVRA